MSADVEQIRHAIDSVRDPEIPSVTIGGLGLVEDVRVADDAIEIDLLPTFVGCPALDAIKADVRKAVAPYANGTPVRVRWVFDPPWTTDRISEDAKASMRLFGIAPPNGNNVRAMQPLLQIAMRCPFCGSADTVVESDFGPTLCRTVRYCNACKNPFEGFKSKAL
jgi:ring-1,2-phenylacetyl-CoA epoxidase subunit PaaD